MSPGVAVAVSLVATCITTAALAPVAVSVLRRRRVVDDPNHRSSHTTATVRGAGVAMVPTAAVATVVFGGRDTIPLLVAAVLLAAVGLADDLRPRPAGFRFAAQLGVGAGLGVWVLDARGLLLAVAAAVFCCGYVNAVNFMDGINGITGLHAVVAGATFGLLGMADDITSLAAAGGALAGAGLGFLPVNFPTARAFPGDVGSYFVGGWIAGLLALGLHEGLDVLVVGGVAVIYVLDTGAVVIRRALRRENLTEAHRQHVYQRLVDSGRSHASVAVMVAAFTAAAAGAAALAASEPAALVLVVAIGVAYLALPAMLISTPPHAAEVRGAS